MISDLVIPTPLTNICYFDGKDNNFQFRVILLIIFIFDDRCKCLLSIIFKLTIEDFLLHWGYAGK